MSLNKALLLIGIGAAAGITYAACKRVGGTVIPGDGMIFCTKNLKNAAQNAMQNAALDLDFSEADVAFNPRESSTEA